MKLKDRNERTSTRQPQTPGGTFMDSQVTSFARTARFSVAMTLAAITTVLWGFAPTYYLRSALHITHYPTGRPVSPHLPVLIHVHALVFSAWLVLLIVQSTLSATRRIRVHRQLG